MQKFIASVMLLSVAIGSVAEAAIALQQNDAPTAPAFNPASLTTQFAPPIAPASPVGNSLIGIGGFTLANYSLGALKEVDYALYNVLSITPDCQVSCVVALLTRFNFSITAVTGPGYTISPTLTMTQLQAFQSTLEPVIAYSYAQSLQPPASPISPMNIQVEAPIITPANIGGGQQFRPFNLSLAKLVQPICFQTPCALGTFEPVPAWSVAPTDPNQAPTRPTVMNSLRGQTLATPANAAPAPQVMTYNVPWEVPSYITTLANALLQEVQEPTAPVLMNPAGVYEFVPPELIPVLPNTKVYAAQPIPQAPQTPN